jgi:hypothetical protein
MRNSFNHKAGTEALAQEDPLPVTVPEKSRERAA